MNKELGVDFTPLSLHVLVLFNTVTRAGQTCQLLVNAGILHWVIWVLVPLNIFFFFFLMSKNGIFNEFYFILFLFFSKFLKENPS